MLIHGWGCYPKIEASIAYPLTSAQCVDFLAHKAPLISYGLRRSYGDSGLAPYVLDMRYLNHFISFDESTGLLRCYAGVSLANILEHFVERGWFLPVTPGTRFVTVGGAIASDVHGKNHHLVGTFSQFVLAIELLLGNGERVVTSPNCKPDLFHATCGGMGLTGLILSATLQLKPIKSHRMVQTSIKVPNLEALLSAFAEQANSSYSVAWIDCLAPKKQLGRSILVLGEHAEDRDMHLHMKKPLPLPLSSFLLNKSSMKLFNSVYYALNAKNNTKTLSLESFFYPLDSIKNWNKFYGKSGFIQYQFVLPLSAGETGLVELLELITASGEGSFLAVLKKVGKTNQNYLSFPIEGYTLALDFKVSANVLKLLDKLDQLVLKYQGRLYLAKDARMSEATFKEAYPQWSQFVEVRAKYQALGKFASLQSKRLGLE